MKGIPNKIYIDEDLINYHCLTYRCDGDLEYIRKDALLDFLRKEISRLPPHSESEFEKSLAIHNAIIYGQFTTMQIILNKIQSL